MVKQSIVLPVMDPGSGDKIGTEYPYRNRTISGEIVTDTLVVGYTQRLDRYALYSVGDLVLYVGPTIQVDTRFTIEKNYIFRIAMLYLHSDGTGSAILLRANHRHAVQSDPKIPLGHIRHVFVAIQTQRFLALQDKQFETDLVRVLTRRLAINGSILRQSIDMCKRMYILQRVTFQPELLERFGAFIGDVAAVLGNSARMEEVFQLLWFNDILRLVDKP